MAYRLVPGRNLGDQLLRIVHAQLAAAMSAARDSESPLAERVHAARVASKRARAAIILIRGHDAKAWDRESRLLRRAAREIAPLRDADVLPATLDALQEQWGDRIDSRTLAHVRHGLLAGLSRHRNATRAAAALERFANRLEPAAKRVTGASVPGGEFATLAAGLERTYRRTRRGFRRATREGTVEAFHCWRRHTKAHTCQCQLLQLGWPDVMGNWIRKLRILGRLLGDEHDLANLQHALSRAWREKSDRRNVSALRDLIAARRTELREEAIDLGRRVCAEKPAAFVRRLEAWWSAAVQDAEDGRAGRESGLNSG